MGRDYLAPRNPKRRNNLWTNYKKSQGVACLLRIYTDADKGLCGCLLRQVLDNAAISRALTELEATVGVRPDAPWGDIAFTLRKDVRQAVSMIASHMGLPIDVRLRILPAGYRPGATDGFRSTALVELDEAGNSGGITAQVTLPSSLPAYGSAAMKGYPIEVLISEEATKEPFAFAAVMAHEFAHVVLYSLRHPKKEDEFYTDLTSMLFGFSDVVKRGRCITKQTSERSGNMVITHTTKTKYGYLSDENFYFAFPKVRILAQSANDADAEFSARFKKAFLLTAQAETALSDFEIFLKELDARPPGSMSSEDGVRVVSFHEPGHLDGYRKHCATRRVVLAGLEREKPVRWTLAAFDRAKRIQAELEDVDRDFRANTNGLHDEVGILRRNSRLLFRLRRKLIRLKEAIFRRNEAPPS